MVPSPDYFEGWENIMLAFHLFQIRIWPILLVGGSVVDGFGLDRSIPPYPCTICLLVFELHCSALWSFLAIPIRPVSSRWAFLVFVLLPLSHPLPALSLALY